MELIFLDEEDCGEYEAQPDEVSQLFGLADQLSEAELERLARIVSKFPPENLQHSAKK